MTIPRACFFLYSVLRLPNAFTKGNVTKKSIRILILLRGKDLSVRCLCDGNLVVNRSIGHKTQFIFRSAVATHSFRNTVILLYASKTRHSKPRMSGIFTYVLIFRLHFVHLCKALEIPILHIVRVIFPHIRVQSNIMYRQQFAVFALDLVAVQSDFLQPKQLCVVVSADKRRTVYCVAVAVDGKVRVCLDIQYPVPTVFAVYGFKLPSKVSKYIFVLTIFVGLRRF